MKTTFINACKYKFNRLLPLVLLMHFCFCASIYAQEFRLSTNISAGPAFHISMKADGYESLDYAFNYSSHLTFSVIEGKFLNYGLALGTYSKNYTKVSKFQSVNYPDSSIVTGGKYYNQVYYYGLNISPIKKLNITEDITVYMNFGVTLSFIPINNQTGRSNPHNDFLHNFIAFTSFDIKYKLNNDMQIGLDVLFFKECFNRYFYAITNPFSTKHVHAWFYGQEFPIFSISPQLSFKYQISN